MNSPSPEAQSDHIVWMDLEMTGLIPEDDYILEIATLITDSELTVIATGPELVVHQPKSILTQMDEWNQEHHQKSGLYQKALDSTISVTEAETATLGFIQKYTLPGKNSIAGNSIWQDRRFLAKHMPHIDKHLHYRIIDISGIKELAKRWYPNLKLPTKKNSHRAMDDIKESIEELKFFRQHIFIPKYQKTTP
ncbi:MAG: oligoribonuclease [Proteobacteria bacterium]|nr:oligoribonuclease [Pseudomonadota bacterium]